ncbi:hypothetical protein M501DRAFT_1054867 [Patellaria atrata CBS 101060]|uniref:WD40 repeat-like protein n=1 Tax=Patellaria atrata CBS 101060 TaxID=1346257 RepID=A0A9P4SFV1_9PEZI|nr:hypothetical protein M501DRAFT_1054867 [Patellaria atrata CBS 101060]
MDENTISSDTLEADIPRDQDKSRFPACIASTGKLFNTTVETPRAPDKGLSNTFRSLQWSPDGTCLLTNSADNILRTFIVPPDLLSGVFHSLTPYASHESPKPVYASASYPLFDLNRPETTLLLYSPARQPIRFIDALRWFPAANNTPSHSYEDDEAYTQPTSSIIASYPLINPLTEEFLAPHSLIFTTDNSHFVAGTTSRLSMFDINYNGQGPIQTHPTIPSRRHIRKGNGVGMKGIISTLSISPATSILAAGTFSRWIGLYAAEGAGETVAVFPLPYLHTSKTLIPEAEQGLPGTGVTQMKWSPCGRYLYVAERQSDAIIIYDIRVTGKRVGWLKGRNAFSPQRMGFDVISRGEGHDVMAGGIDGKVRVWGNPGRGCVRYEDEITEGVMRDVEWEGHEDVVCAAVFHSCGSVLATASGQQRPRVQFDSNSNSHPSSSDSDTSSDSESESQPENSSCQEVGRVGSKREQRERAVRDNSIKIWDLEVTGGCAAEERS